MLPIILNIIFCISFAAFAYVNLNDKDSWLWVSIYFVASLSCGLAVFGNYYATFYLIAIAFYMLFAVKLFFAEDGVLDWMTKYRRESIVASMQATKPYIEKSREFFGLIIISAALLFNYFIARGNHPDFGI